MQIRVINNHPGVKIQKKEVNNLVRLISKDEGIIEAAKEISIIFVDDDYLRKLHKDYLNDDSYTDVMSFNLNDDDQIEGEIYISVDRAKHHANKFNVSDSSEIARLIIHGILHLKGYDDATEDQKQEMHELENAYLERYPGSFNLL
jgi:rRNA maturation RNase YbeY